MEQKEQKNETALVSQNPDAVSPEFVCYHRVTFKTLTPCSHPSTDRDAAETTEAPTGLLWLHAFQASSKTDGCQFISAYSMNLNPPSSCSNLGSHSYIQDSSTLWHAELLWSGMKKESAKTQRSWLGWLFERQCPTLCSATHRNFTPVKAITTSICSLLSSGSCRPSSRC